MGRKKKRQSQKPPHRRPPGSTASAPQADVRMALQQGMSLFQSGRLQEAERLFNSILARDPKNISALQLLGIVVFQQGRSIEGEKLLRKAIALKPGIAELHYNLGKMLDEQGKLDEAVEAFRKAVRLDAKNEWIYNDLGTVLVKLGKLGEAETTLRASLEINQNNATSLSNLGLVLWQSDRLDEAVEMLERALKIAPSHVEALSNLGGLHLGRGEPEKAEGYLRQAVVIEPENIDVLNNLACTIMEIGNQGEAIALARKATEYHPKSAEAFLNYGRVLFNVGDENGAVEAYVRALEISPGNFDVLKSLGVALVNQGRFDEAREYYHEALKIKPHDPGVHVMLMRIDPPDASDGEVAELEQLYRNREISVEDKRLLAFGLASVFEKGGEYDKAFGYLDDGNGLKRRSYEYQLEDDKAFFLKLKEVFNAAFFQEHSGCGIEDRTPIFILGMPRSGTTVTEQILASHAQVFGAGELNYLKQLLMERCDTNEYKRFPGIAVKFTDDDFRQLGVEYVNRLKEQCGSTERVTDKLPHNFLHVGMIRLMLPNAKVIHCRRDPMDNCLSIFKKDFKELHNYSHDQSELGGYYRLYQDLMGHWHRVLPGFMLDFQYEELVADQESMTRRLLEFCELPWDENCLQFHKTNRAVRTASRTQVRKKIYSDSVQLWRRYERHLKPLIDALSVEVG